MFSEINFSAIFFGDFLSEFFSMFMLLSHKAQYNYKINNIIETEFDKNEVNDALSSLIKITE